MPVQPIPDDYKAKIGGMSKALVNVRQNALEFQKVDPDEVAVIRMKAQNAIDAAERMLGRINKRAAAENAGENPPPVESAELPNNANEPTGNEPGAPDSSEWASMNRDDLLDELDENEIGVIKGTGKDGYVTKADLVKYLADHR